ncbi:MAG: formyltetrahydrofolate deformylase [Alphaproteobacteria bacterium]|nr:formyltetrahydrofolate deformylase [Alphaproteobacteria bacterium]
MTAKRYILTLSCKDVRGIVASVTGFLHEQYGFVIESAQFGDESTDQFFLRIEFSVDAKHSPGDAELRTRFGAQVADKFGMQWQMVDKQQKSRVLIMVSKYGHCLNDLLYRYSTGQLPIEIPAIISNHTTWEHAAKWHDIPFYHLPTPVGSKAAQEEEVLRIAQEHNIDLVVLARYMQILSDDMCKKLTGRAINIHHSFLPSFKGAKPYMQAFDRGVKLIGATAHYVTSDLDEGPIIEQEVARVDHTHQPSDLEAIGRDTECMVLARAIKYHIEHRVLVNGHKTVVFK